MTPRPTGTAGDHQSSQHWRQSGTRNQGIPTTRMPNPQKCFSPAPARLRSGGPRWRRFADFWQQFDPVDDGPLLVVGPFATRATIPLLVQWLPRPVRYSSVQLHHMPRHTCTSVERMTDSNPHIPARQFELLQALRLQPSKHGRHDRHSSSVLMSGQWPCESTAWSILVVRKSRSSYLVHQGAHIRSPTTSTMANSTRRPRGRQELKGQDGRSTRTYGQAPVGTSAASSKCRKLL